MKDNLPLGLLTKPKGEYIKRLNKLPLVIVFVILVVVIASLGYTIFKRGHQVQNKDTQVYSANHSNMSVQAIIEGRPDGVIAPIEDSVVKQPFLKIEPPSMTFNTLSPSPNYSESRLYEKESPSMLIKDEMAEVSERKRAIYEEALHSNTKIDTGHHQSQPSDASNIQTPPQDGLSRFSNTIRQLSNLKPGDPDPNKQGHKNTFLGSDKDGEMINNRIFPVSPYEIKAGTILPAIMITGINSDLPGQITAQLSQHVYDTATGKYLLLPQGSKLIGLYDSHVSHGQKRVLVAWNRIILPDASSIHLGVMAGSDAIGRAGFRDKVNSHTFKIFGNAFMLSLLSAGVQMSQGSDQGVGLASSAREEISAAIGQQMGEVGMEMVRKNMNIQPTLTIRPGYRFNVMVNRDMVFKSEYASDR
ncbi:MAG: hypothetical protein HRT90_11990 [Candidatus Margulisbacteria bacterium]|nr:hypothetical protein [Candidatus Margulisiibacteriota bacterium]